MNEHDFAELEDPATWEDDEGAVHPPVQNPYAVVSVRLTLQVLERVEQAATAHGLRLTEFIRHAALSTVDTADTAPKSTPVRRPA